MTVTFRKVDTSGTWVNVATEVARVVETGPTSCRVELQDGTVINVPNRSAHTVLGYFGSSTPDLPAPDA